VRFGLCAGDLEILRRLGDWGYDYAEIAGPALLPFEGDRAFAARKVEIGDTGIPIEALAWFIPGSVPVIGPKVDLGLVRGCLETTIGRAAEVGVKVINWGSVASRRVPEGWPMSKAWSQIERAAALIAEIAEAVDVSIAVESVHPREANIFFYLTEAINLVTTVNRPNFRLNVDYFHLVRQNEPDEHMTLAAPWLIHAHTSDDHRGFPAIGSWDQRRFLRLLKAAGYNGRVSFEVNGTLTPQFADAAQRSVRLMRELQAEVATERD
jgi:sugar phosphate isomerase/epimerase